MSPVPVKGTKRRTRKEIRKAAESNFGRHCGIDVTAVRDGYARATMTVEEQLLNRLRITHGGALFTLADRAFGAAAGAAGDTVVAMSMTIHYLRPSSKGDVLVAEATKVRRGRKTCLYEVRIQNKRTKKLAATVCATGFIVT